MRASSDIYREILKHAKINNFTNLLQETHGTFKANITPYVFKIGGMAA